MHNFKLVIIKPQNASFIVIKQIIVREKERLTNNYDFAVELVHRPHTGNDQHYLFYFFYFYYTQQLNIYLELYLNQNL